MTPHPPPAKTVAEIIRQRREALGLTLAALAEKVGVTKSYLSMIENRRVLSPPSRHVIQALEKALGITDGQLLRAAAWEAAPPEVRQELENLSAAAHRGRELARRLLEIAEKRKPSGPRDLDQLFHSGQLTQLAQAALGLSASADPNIRLEPATVYRVPLINKVAAGYPRGFTDLDYPARVADEYVFVPDLNDPYAFAARVVGDSMLPDYQEGDIVVFSPAAPVTDGSDCFVRLLPDHETTFKRVFFDPNDLRPEAPVRLQPLNPRFEPTIVQRQQIAGMYKAVWRLQRLAGF